MNLEISEAERSYLLDVLTEELGRLRSEIYRTDARDFKDELKGREATLKRLISRLGAGS